MSILDLGAPCFDPNSLVYGTQLYNSQSCTPPNVLVMLVMAWIRGYETNANRTTSTPYIVAAGTSNSLTGAVPGFALTGSQMTAHGQTWFNSIVQSVSTAVTGLAAPITVWSGTDTEEASDGNWYGAGPSRAWIDGYSGAAGAHKPCSATSPAMTVDYGDYVPGEPGWTQGDVYHIAWEAAASCVVPEIYYTANASEWQSLNQWAAGAGHPSMSFAGVLSEDGAGGSLKAGESWTALQSATGQSAPYLSVIGSAGTPPPQVPDAPTAVSAVAGAASATVSWSAPAWDGGAKITGYTVVASAAGSVAQSVTLNGWPAARTTTVNGLINGTPYTFTVSATNSAGTGTASTPSAPVTPSQLRPYTTVSTSQYRLGGSDGATWVDIDSQNLSLVVQPTLNAQAVVTANADLWTDAAGVNQDIAVAVNGTVVAWKESGGYAGTFSPNAATVHAVYQVNAGTAYTIKLRWKANKTTPASIYAGAGPIGGQFSPTRLTVQLVPSAADIASAVVASQPSLSSSNGSSWTDVDTQHLSFSYTAPATGNAIVTGNADLWTSTAGYNQDIGLAVNGTVVAWKESGGRSGAFSPNAAVVETSIPVTAGNQYLIALKWKTNRSAAGVTIYAGAGPAGGPFSPTRLSVRFVGSAMISAVSPSQYMLTSSDGATWTPIDSATLTLAGMSQCLAVITANSDLWTASPGFNQDIAIAVNSLDAIAYPNGIVAWKESGGSSAFSPNAAYAQTVIALPAGRSYIVTLLWKANRPTAGQSIVAGAGPGAPFSPTSLSVEESC
jgi:hypothetical protein